MTSKEQEQYIAETNIPGLLVIKRPTFSDDRGFFRETFRMTDLTELGIDFKPVQMNHSRSIPRVIRALHAENWNKLVYPVNGSMFAAIVDIRQDSVTFGNVETFEFGGDDTEPKMLYIPAGLANSICVVGNQPVDYIYLVDAYYSGADTRAIAWNDPNLAINWPVNDPLISERDKLNPTLQELFQDKFE